MNFNGTAGVWRRKAIDDAGGWQADTLTEDLDLSYRAQLRGWKFGYLPDVVVPAELPAQIEAYKKQQYRWAKGSSQTIKKILPRLLRADIPFTTKIMGMIHLSGYFVCPLMLAGLLLMLPLGLLDPGLLHIFPYTMVAAFGPPIMYALSRTDENPHLIDRIKLLPILTVLGIGLTLNNSIAVLEGLFGKDRGTFIRTPKFNLVGSGSSIADNSYVLQIHPMVWGEIALAAYCLLTILIFEPRFGPGFIPWISLYMAGYLYMAGMNIFQTWQVARLRSVKTVQA